MKVEFRSDVDGLLPKFRAVRSAEDREFELKEGNKVFGTVTPAGESFSVRFSAGSKTHRFSSLSVQDALNTITIFLLLPKRIRETETEIKNLSVGNLGLFDQFRMSGLDKDLAIEQKLRNCRKWLKGASEVFDDCHLRVTGSRELRD